MAKGRSGRGAREAAPGTVAAEPAADLPGYCLAHLIRENVNGGAPGSIVRWFDLYPIEIPRPAHGRTTAVIECGTCGKGFSCTVSGRKRMRRRRLAAWLAIAATGAASCAVFVFLTLLFGTPLLLVPLGVVAVVLLCWGLYLEAVKPTGVKLRKGGQHEIRRPGDSRSVTPLPGAQGA